MPQAQRQILIAVSGMFQPLYAFISAVATPACWLLVALMMQ